MEHLLEPKSIIDVGYLHDNKNGHECHYCKPPKTDNKFSSWGFCSNKMASNDYEMMMNKGWRRSGNYFYKPDLNSCCCKLYTIRLDVTKFQISKKQKKMLKKFNNFLNGKYDNKDNKEDEKEKKTTIVEKKIQAKSN